MLVQPGIVDDNLDTIFAVGNNREMPFGTNPTREEISAFVTFAIAKQWIQDIIAPTELITEGLIQDARDHCIPDINFFGARKIM